MASELREALNAANGIWTPEPAHDVIILSPEIAGERLARVKRTLPWLGTLGTLTLAGVLTAIVVAGIFALTHLL